MSKIQPLSSARQNADLTFKLNRHYGRHGWLRLTPAYSVKLVSEILKASESGDSSSRSVFRDGHNPSLRRVRR